MTGMGSIWGSGHYYNLCIPRVTGFDPSGLHVTHRGRLSQHVKRKATANKKSSSTLKLFWYAKTISSGRCNVVPVAEAVAVVVCFLLGH